VLLIKQRGWKRRVASKKKQSSQSKGGRGGRKKRAMPGNIEGAVISEKKTMEDEHREKG